MTSKKQPVEIEYFFIWGNYPALALAELLSTLARWGIEAKVKQSSVEAGILVANQYLPEEFIEQLGGTMKIGQVIDEKPVKELDAELIASFLTSSNPTGKLHFGLSQYRLNNLSTSLSKKALENLGKEIKRLLKDTRAVRWVTSREANLSSVVVKKNKLVGTGAEIVLLYKRKTVCMGKTTAVQPFESYGKRDYGRVASDGKVGMLPPKLAQMMLNVSGANVNEILLDPFCGYGTILQEALLMGWKHVVGSDAAKSSVEGTKKNLLWLKENYKLSQSVIRIFHSDARSISEHVRGGYITTVVTEPHLGPALKKRVTKAQASKIKDELEALYYSTFVDFTKFLRTGSRVVVAWPVFILSNVESGLMYIELLKKFEKIGFNVNMPFDKELKKFDMGGRSTRGTLIYGRPQQKVWREIIVFDYTAKK